MSDNTYQVSLYAVQAGDWVSRALATFTQALGCPLLDLTLTFFQLLMTHGARNSLLPAVAEDCLFPSYSGTVGSTETCRFLHYSQAIGSSLVGSENPILSVGESSDTYFVSSGDKLILLNYCWQTHFVLDSQAHLFTFFVDQGLKTCKPLLSAS